jgi:hypothetical protein
VEVEDRVFTAAATFTLVNKTKLRRRKKLRTLLGCKSREKSKI